VLACLTTRGNLRAGRDTQAGSAHCSACGGWLTKTSVLRGRIALGSRFTQSRRCGCAVAGRGSLGG
jgi:hypothetical protein